MRYWICASILINIEVTLGKYNWKDLKLLSDHMPMVFRNNHWLRRQCEDDDGCPYKNIIWSNLCWGYEENCSAQYLADYTQCENEDEFYRYRTQGDFGILKGYLQELEGRKVCKAKSTSSSYLICTKDAKMCKAKNLYLHLPNFSERDGNVVLVPKDGVIGGYCDVDSDVLRAETTVKRSLSTWGHQLQSFKKLQFDPFNGTSEKCDVVINKPVVFVQLDAVGNLYHHFCDFFNLYLTQHSNSSWFGTDVQIIRWNEHQVFRDPFMDVWKVFTDNNVLTLRDFVEKRVCIPDATFALLPRMAHGLYYSTYLEQNCRGSRLMKSFSDHVLHRLNVTQDASETSSVIRVTFLQRGGKRKEGIFRRILNVDALVKRLEKIPHFEVQVVSYDFGEMSFREQLRVTRNTDIFIGMHGAGLAHFMFLPDWAVAFELYNCGDIRCYRDLAGLRGVKYMTWEDSAKLKEHDKGVHERYGSNSKFWNYSFDVEEFIRLVRKARDTLLEHERFTHFKKTKHDGKRMEL